METIETSDGTDVLVTNSFSGFTLLSSIILFVVVSFAIYLFVDNRRNKKYIENQIKLDNPDYKYEKLNITQKSIAMFKLHPIISFYVISTFLFSSLIFIGLKWTGALILLVGIKVFFDYPQYRKEKNLKEYEASRIDIDTVELSSDEIFIFNELNKNLHREIVLDHREMEQKRKSIDEEFKIITHLNEEE